MKNLSLPPELETAITEALRALPTSQWVSAAQSLSARYRGPRQEGAGPLARGLEAALAYVALILPATYAQLSGAMAEIARRAPYWAPVSLLDIGSGPGTALWAAVERWPSLQSVSAWEREPAFIALGRRLAQSQRDGRLAQTQWQRVWLERPLPLSSSETGTRTYDLVVLGHVLNELSVPLQQRVLAYAWERCVGLLLIVEPGTSDAFLVVKAAREQLLALGAKTVAPCAHDAACPLIGDWCHFPQQLTRPAFQRRAKEAPAGWEASKFSYAAMARFGPEDPIWGRLIHQPRRHKAFVELTVSAQPGVGQYRVPRRDRASYQEARSLHWGEALSHPPEGASLVEPAGAALTGVERRHVRLARRPSESS